jgi:LmbE family N-acetylglucosaminyl deacetylase
MATLVFFHAHPDDEAIATGGTMAAASAAGHRVVLVLATDGALGTPLVGGSSLAEVRRAEALAAAKILGAARVEFLGYRDSGEAGDPGNDDPRCFWRADVDGAAGRLAGILRDEGAEALTIYDATGVTGHPDHLQVHRVGTRAAELLRLAGGSSSGGDLTVYQCTLAQSQLERLRAWNTSVGTVRPPAGELGVPTGTPEEAIATAVDVREWVHLKRAAMAAHASQIPAGHFMIAMPSEVFEQVWGRECYLRSDSGGGGPLEDLNPVPLASPGPGRGSW